MNDLPKMSHYLVQQVGHQVLVDREQVPHRPVQAVHISAVLHTLSGLQRNMYFYSMPRFAFRQYSGTKIAFAHVPIREDGDGDSVLPALLSRPQDAGVELERVTQLFLHHNKVSLVESEQ